MLPAMKTVIDGIASEIRAGKREETFMMTHSNDDKEVYRQFRRELLGEGFTSDDIQLAQLASEESPETAKPRRASRRRRTC